MTNAETLEIALLEALKLLSESLGVAFDAQATAHTASESKPFVSRERAALH